MVGDDYRTVTIWSVDGRCRGWGDGATAPARRRALRATWRNNSSYTLVYAGAKVLSVWCTNISKLYNLGFSELTAVSQCTFFRAKNKITDTEKSKPITHFKSLKYTRLSVTPQRPPSPPSTDHIVTPQSFKGTDHIVTLRAIAKPTRPTQPSINEQ